MQSGRPAPTAPATTYAPMSPEARRHRESARAGKALGTVLRWPARCGRTAGTMMCLDSSSKTEGNSRRARGELADPVGGGEPVIPPPTTAKRTDSTLMRPDRASSRSVWAIPIRRRPPTSRRR
jgi:hypothetical protein